MRSRLIRFAAGTELGVVTSLLFAGLYTWPLLTFDKPGKTFRFIFVTWMFHIAFIALASHYGGKPGSEEHDDAETEPRDPSAE